MNRRIDLGTRSGLLGLALGLAGAVITRVIEPTMLPSGDLPARNGGAAQVRRRTAETRDGARDSTEKADDPRELDRADPASGPPAGRRQLRSGNSRSSTSSSRGPRARTTRSIRRPVRSWRRNCRRKTAPASWRSRPGALRRCPSSRRLHDVLRDRQPRGRYRATISFASAGSSTGSCEQIQLVPAGSLGLAATPAGDRPPLRRPPAGHGHRVRGILGGTRAGCSWRFAGSSASTSDLSPTPRGMSSSR